MSGVIKTQMMFTDDEQRAQSKKRVAVIGSGMAGLTTAYLLHRSPEYEVKAFESVRPKTSNFSASHDSSKVLTQD
jgi:2-polyprenyl-6-methoxyphenol hydroxylase-like FAD-dependent oxidoreductase